MTQEDKVLLAKDICARLPYGVKVGFSQSDSVLFRIVNYYSSLRELEVEEENDNNYCIVKHIYPIDCYRPYLRPMSSMTEEEFEKLKEYSGLKYEQLDLASFQNGTYKCLDFYLSEVPSYVVILVFDWLNANHFDYRLLIEKSLAIVAPEEMYK